MSLGGLSKLSCFLLNFYYLPVLLLLLRLGLFGCLVTKEVAWVHGREVSWDLSGAEGPLSQSQDTLQCIAAVLIAHPAEEAA